MEAHLVDHIASITKNKNYAYKSWWELLDVGQDHQTTAMNFRERYNLVLIAQLGSSQQYDVYSNKHSEMKNSPQGIEQFDNRSKLNQKVN